MNTHRLIGRRDMNTHRLIGRRDMNTHRLIGKRDMKYVPADRETGYKHASVQSVVSPPVLPELA